MIAPLFQPSWVGYAWLIPVVDAQKLVPLPSDIDRWRYVGPVYKSGIGGHEITTTSWVVRHTHAGRGRWTRQLGLIRVFPRAAWAIAWFDISPADSRRLLTRARDSGTHAPELQAGNGAMAALSRVIHLRSPAIVKEIQKGDLL